MRDIRFRAWDKDANKFYYFLPIEPDSFNYWVDCDIQQYTGLTDRQGVEIYEGDVVLVTDDDDRTDFSDGGIGPVEFLEHDMWYLSGEVNNGLSDINYQYYIEVIGNIYENPELLTTGNDLVATNPDANTDLLKSALSNPKSKAEEDT